MKNKIEIPSYVVEIIQSLEKAGFEACVVGGCVRDLFLEIEPKDWDIATNARPEEILKIFPDSVYENEFGTVGVKVKSSKFKVQGDSLKLKVESAKNEKKTEVVEVTTYRIESKYSDKRHPDKIRFARTLEEDLSRRDFTINAMALKVKSQKSKVKSANKNSKVKKIEEDYKLIDPYDGQKDLKDKIIRAVGDPNERFEEDALRMMRAIRFVSTLNGNYKLQITNDKQSSNSKTINLKPWEIEKKTLLAIKKNAKSLKYISQERIRDELEKIILSSDPARGMELLHETGLLQFIIPEIEAGWETTQSRHHYHGPYNTVGKHLLASLKKCPSKKMEVRLAALLHDIGKPKSKRGEGETATFHSHEYIGERMTRQILERLRFSRQVVEKTTLLVRNHMFYYNVDEVGEAGVRRVIRKVGLENINDLIDVRIADRLGSGVPKAIPYKLRHFKFMVEKVSRDPLSVKQLKINGNDLMKFLKIQPGPKIGAILDILLSRVVDEPTLNKKDRLLELAEILNKEELASLRNQAKEKIAKEKKRKKN